jgi:hypothetical protein
MKYWYKKEYHEQGGHYDFIGHRELIYRGKDKPEEFIVRYIRFPSEDNESLKEYYQRFIDAVKTISSQEYLDECKNDISTREWKIDWKVLANYNEIYYSHNPTDIVEITKETVKIVIGNNHG